jgi:hypothetical protein
MDSIPEAILREVSPSIADHPIRLTRLDVTIDKAGSEGIRVDEVQECESPKESDIENIDTLRIRAKADSAEICGLAKSRPRDAGKRQPAPRNCDAVAKPS